MALKDDFNVGDFVVDSRSRSPLPYDHNDGPGQITARVNGIFGEKLYMIWWFNEGASQEYHYCNIAHTTVI